MARRCDRLFWQRGRVSHGFPFPGDAAHVHGAADGRPIPYYRHSGADAADSRDLPVGSFSDRKNLRKKVDERFRHRMLLAEANQWPEDAIAYFGSGDECHMAFHFPVMPRMFMALRMEDRFPIIDILAQTPPIPETCQWALFQIGKIFVRKSMSDSAIVCCLPKRINGPKMRSPILAAGTSVTWLSISR